MICFMLLYIISLNFRQIAEILNELEQKRRSGQTDARAVGRNDLQQNPSGRWWPRTKINEQIIMITCAFYFFLLAHVWFLSVCFIVTYLLEIMCEYRYTYTNRITALEIYIQRPISVHEMMHIHEYKLKKHSKQRAIYKNAKIHRFGNCRP